MPEKFSYEFLAQFAITKEEDIDNIPFNVLKDMDFLMRCQVLATALAHDNLANLAKNGRKANPKKGITAIKGYPALLKQWKIDETWKSLKSFFLPEPKAILKNISCRSLLLKIGISLQSPFFSRDDCSFYPHENPLKKEWVFGVPYLSASGVKGLIRWAYKMVGGDKASHDLLFGTANEEQGGTQGLLYTYPLFWSAKPELEVINPHDRQTGAGKNPIKYEVIKPPATTNLICLLIERLKRPDFLSSLATSLITALNYLLTEGHLSAKSSVGWGQVKIDNIEVWFKGFKGLTTEEPSQQLWSEVLDKSGNLKPIDQITTATLSRLTHLSKSQVKKRRDQAYERLKELYQKRSSEQGQQELFKQSFKDLNALNEFLKEHAHAD